MSDANVKSVKYTPGPYFVSKKFEVGPRSAADDQSLGMITPIADVYGENREADARLLAAAPELLEALKVLLDEAENFSVSGVYFSEECMGHKGPALAHAAIAKAEAR